jgi:hypothetical protein
MPGTPETANLLAGTLAPATGIYVVTHREPAHAVPHDVLIPAAMILPKCKRCIGVRFSLRSLATPPIEENEFFR